MERRIRQIAARLSILRNEEEALRDEFFALTYGWPGTWVDEKFIRAD